MAEVTESQFTKIVTGVGLDHLPTNIEFYRSLTSLVLQHGIAWCDVLHAGVLRGGVLRGSVLCGGVLRGAVLYRAISHGVVLIQWSADGTLSHLHLQLKSFVRKCRVTNPR